MELPEAKRPWFEDRPEDAIIFIERDMKGVLALHNDAVVVIANITDYNIHHIFIDNGSSVDILYFSIFIHMGFTPDQLSTFDTPI